MTRTTRSSWWTTFCSSRPKSSAASLPRWGARAPQQALVRLRQAAAVVTESANRVFYSVRFPFSRERAKMKTKTWVTILSLSLACGLALLAGCGKKEETAEQPAAAPAAAPAATPIVKDTAATVSGTVKFEGEAPKAV